MNIPVGQATLPIEHVLPELLTALEQRDEVVLQAPPGAGKTTLVPLAVLSAEWLQGQRILVLEPRRIAARAAAERMAKLLGEPVGRTVGYRVRLDSNISADSRIEVVTEGILTRYLQADPSLNGIGLVIFDEFHERSLDADLGLALALQGRKLFRDPATGDGELPLKLLLMSATLEDTRIAQLLSSAAGAAPIIRSEGRQFPVTVSYGEPWQAGESVVPRVVSMVLQAIQNDFGSVLVFLPGQSEIRAVNQALSERLAELSQTLTESLLITPLFGDLSLAEQRRAIEPAPPGKRKIVLATAIAESSLTIEGVTVVVDAGLSRTPMFDPRTGMTRLQTRRLSRAASVQRMGRAGRLQAGQCYRLWSASQQEQLQSFTPPEMVQADLASLALQLVSWGVDDPTQLDWLDPPPAVPYQQALDLLAGLGAIEQQQSGVWRSTQHGEAMATFPAHPRIAHMLLQGEAQGLRNLACDLAALLGERDPLYGVGADLALRLDLFQARAERNLGSAMVRLRQQSQQFRTLCQNLPSSAASQSVGVAIRFNNDEQRVAYLLACAYPDRIALRRQTDSYDYLLSNGRAARLHAPDSVQRSPCLVIAQLGGRQGGRFEQTSHDQIFMAAPLDLALFDGPLQALVSQHKVVEWDKQTERLRAEQQRRVGALVLSSTPLESIPLEEKRTLLLCLLRKRGLSVLPWTDELRQWQGRVQLLRSTDLLTSAESVWPDLSDEALVADLEHWLAPYLDHVNQLSHLARLDLSAILLALLPWPLPKRLDEEAPVKLNVPSGSQIMLDYRVNPPVLAVKLQELFGCATTPTIAQGRVAVMLHLLSPARRPLAVTQDLASFWQNAYDEVKKQGRGRYPKHPWPDDPLATQATSRTKHGAKLQK